MDLTELKEVEIDVTQEDIEKGVRNDCANCPIAKAFSRRLEAHNLNLTLMEVCHEHVVIANKEAAAEFDLPQEASNFISAFDNKRPVAPFKFKAKLYEHSGCKV
jgi:hypothetical protein